MKNKVILIVDDSVSIRQMLNFTLQNAGYEVIEAVDGKDALSKANGAQVHMVIADINMPNMDGIELTRTLRSTQKFKFVPIIVLTTESRESRKQEGRSAGATGWIIKPFQPEQLLAIVKKLIGG